MRTISYVVRADGTMIRAVDATPKEREWCDRVVLDAKTGALVRKITVQELCEIDTKLIMENEPSGLLLKHGAGYV